MSSSEGGVGSPYDSPTGEFPAVGEERPKMTKQIPRTDEELGLDPEVDAAPGSGAAAAKGATPAADATRAAPKSTDPDAPYPNTSNPPATAGMIITSLPDVNGVSIPSRVRHSSPST